MRNLVIVESPTKARTLSRFLGGDYRVEATMGHVRDLPEKKLGIEIKKIENVKLKMENLSNDFVGSYEFIPQYQVIQGRKARITELKKLAEESSEIILATDPDREGEAIAWHVKDVLCSNSKFKIQNSKFTRIVFHEITKSAIDDALKYPRDVDMKLVDAQQARRILDRLVGYKLSPLLWVKLGKRWLSAGRVQSVAVRLIVEREREITAFKLEEYWIVEAEFQKIQNSEFRIQNKNLNSFIARLIQVDGKKAEVKNKETADGIVSDLEKATYTVAKVTTKEVRRYPAPPFTTSTLQQTAASRFGWSAKRTIKTAQSLYEEGYITYHRTDSTSVAKEAIAMVRNYVNSEYGKEYLPASPKFYKTKSKVAQEAHEAIRPTRCDGLSALYRDVEGKLGREALRLLQMITKRFVASQMNEAVFDATSADISASEKYLFRATGQKLKFDGWIAVYSELKTQNSKLKSTTQNLKINNINTDRRDDERNIELPELTVGEMLNLIKLLPQQKFTEPPPRYNEASLIKTLEELGIGRPSTYAPILSTIQDRKYVEKTERRFQPTDLGFAVTDFLVVHFPKIFDVTFTAKMEDDLDEIASGSYPWEKVVGDFYDPFISRLDTVFKEAGRVKVDLGTSDEKCPKCGSQLVYRISKYGKFLACSKYPECKFTKTIIEKAGISCPKCGGDIILKKTRRGKSFYGCGNYPKCTFAAWKKEEILKLSNNPITQ